ncbi:MAG: hypothetical protein IPK70_09080 [Flavobacteriales bacterium]|nr:hypothetical protein [Flavobacteriales bacterium]
MAFGQDSLEQRVRLPIWTFHQKRTTTVGLNMGLGTVRETPRHVMTIGVHAEALGVGLFLLLAPREATARDSVEWGRRLNDPLSERIYGMSVSPLGAVCDCAVHGLSMNGGGVYQRQVNGLSAAFAINQVDLMSGVQAACHVNFAFRASGLQASFIRNSAVVLHGVQVSAINRTVHGYGIQVGIYNQAKRLRGAQIGIWNVNQRRKWPLINWA